MPGLQPTPLMNVEIKGSGTGFPVAGKWITNDNIHALMYGEDWKKVMAAKKLGIDYYKNELGFSKRYWVHTPDTIISHDELTSADLMIEAANNAINDSGLSINEIDFVIAITITSPKYSTSMGPYVAGKLGIKAPAIEMKTGCASSIFSIIIAAQLIQNGAKNILITCGETTSKIIQPNTNMMYAGGDAGAAIILSKSTSTDKGIIASYINSEGSYSSHMGVKGLLPPNSFDIEQQNYFLSYSDAAEIFLDETWSSTPGILYKASGLSSSDIDCLIPHQVLKKRTRFISEASKIALNKTIDILGDYANCGSATILLALHHAIKNKQLNDGQHAMMVAAGGGVSWGGLILKT